MATGKRRTELHELTLPESKDTVPHNFEDVFNQQISDLKDSVTKLSLSDLSATKSVFLLFRNCGDWFFKDQFKHYRRKIVEKLCEFGFVEDLTRFLDELDKSDLFKKSSIFSLSDYDYRCKILSHVLTTMCNFSDTSSRFGKGLAENGAIPILLAFLTHEDLLPTKVVESNNWDLVNSILGILGNIARLCPDYRQKFRDENAVNILLGYSEIKKKVSKADCYLTVSFLITDDEVNLLEDAGNTIPFLINCLKKALSLNDELIAYGYSPAEILLGLNSLASNDANKVRIVECGGLQLLSRAADVGNLAISIIAANITWRLAFVDENRHKIIAETKLIKSLKSWQSSQNYMLKEASKGALWETFEGTPESLGKHTSNVVDKQHNCPHVMLSYQWDVQPIMLKLKDKLVRAGYNVWMDVDRMEGDILGAMANAVENAAVLVIAVSKKYKDSNSCRTEATYAYKHSKQIIPLIVEEKYVADGWLGALIGTLKYFKVTCDSSVDAEYENIQKEIGTRGLSEDVIVPVKEIPTSSQKPKPSDSVDGGVKKHVSNWTKDEVKTWLTENKMAELTTCMKDVDGEILVQMIKLSNKAPEYFYSQLKLEFNMNLIQVLQFDNSLGKLKIS
ncbi:uncharacterized protein [Antedon mediterranea]|uniref:uncharacterized protein n=1 Tax=Antedon mediterranea TaxID=105859 RepID=UPI003AF7F4C5